MSFRTIAEAFEVVGVRHANLRSEVAGLAPDQLNFRCRADSWTIGEIVEHLSIVQEGMGKIASKLVKEAEAAGAKGSPDGLIAGVNTDFIPARGVRRLDAPENVRPRGEVSLDDSLSKLDKDFQRLQEMRHRIESVDLSSFTFPHPAFGPLSGYQWLALLAAHEGRHLEQIREIKGSEGYPG
jgi:hypothetical protein